MKYAAGKFWRSNGVLGRTSDGAANYTWNAASQLTKITAGSTTTDYSYDGDNHRVSTTIGRTTTTNSYDPLSGVLVLEQGGGKTLRKYDHGLGLLSMTAGNITSSYLTDAYGSVRGVVSSTGTLSLGYAYNPYGDTRSTTTGKSAPQNPLQFIGAYNNNPLYQVGARDYNAADGRFLSPDPAGIPGLGYTYTAGNPMAGIDPTGLSEQDWREVVNQIANGVATASGGVALLCLVAVICAEVTPFAAGLSGAASGVAVVTSDETNACLSGHGSCPEAIIGAAIGAGAGKFGVGGKAAKGLLGSTSIGFRSDTSHIFRNAVGHLAEDTAENRALIQSALDPQNLRSTLTLKDGSTLEKYFKTLPDGTQVWAEVRNGQEITNGGLNGIAK
ncbi:RHS repeat-associated core domain-containing protein [Arthrobacter sp. NPDC056727]|uniref:RHS repeat-associated core domain-containing protein n=1 Tax=Arthrobacter sp. NPDC056727 TaxID=3345927 RepID=UPI00366D43A6